MSPNSGWQDSCPHAILIVHIPMCLTLRFDLQYQGKVNNICSK